MRYYTLTKDTVADWEVDPYFLRCYGGNWYLVGYDHKSGHIPMFSLARIRTLTVTDRHFELQEGFNADDYLRGTFEVMERKERHKVRMRFEGLAARLIEERVWHPSQKLTKRRDGSVIFEMTVADIEEVGRWLLSWGAHARALAPEELVQYVRASARAISGLYKKRSR